MVFITKNCVSIKLKKEKYAVTGDCDGRRNWCDRHLATSQQNSILAPFVLLQLFEREKKSRPEAWPEFSGFALEGEKPWDAFWGPRLVAYFHLLPPRPSPCRVMDRSIKITIGWSGTLNWSIANLSCLTDFSRLLRRASSPLARVRSTLHVTVRFPLRSAIFNHRSYLWNFLSRNQIRVQKQVC